MIVLIDNYDSFVHNIARYFQCCGQSTTVHRNDAITLQDLKALAPTALVISPGPCTPTEAGISVEAIQHFAPTIPILGICLGHQAIAVAFGGRVTRAHYPLHGGAAHITHDDRGIFEGLPNPLAVGRYHSLIVSYDAFPTCLEVSATSVQGEIMAIQHRTYPTIGVQFHPESVLTEQGYAMIEAFIKQYVQKKGAVNTTAPDP